MNKKYTPVIIESPYSPGFSRLRSACSCGLETSGPIFDEICNTCEQNLKWEEALKKNVEYARAATRDSLLRGEAPFLSHLLYTQPDVLDDEITTEREHGIRAGFAWRELAVKTIVYTDLGISPGMHLGIEDAKSRGLEIEYRTIPDWNKK
jgi:hypothetical protein